MEPIFKALSDASRRYLLDQLYQRDGQTLAELQAYLPEMTRFGVMKHLAVLEEAGLISTTRVGREKFHYLNPVPIQEIADRWISKFAQPWVGALAGLKHDLELETMERPKHIYDVYIRATPERVWEAITRGDQTVAWFHETTLTGELKPGAPFQLVSREGDSAVDGEVLEIDPPRRFVHTWKANWGPDFANDRPSRVTWELTPMGETTRLRLTHDDFDGETVTYKSISQGWAPLLNSLKSFIETGEPLEIAEEAS
ncbi:MAG: ArsR/SmtB family transcription factor [Dehalococcoidia bacterium]